MMLLCLLLLLVMLLCRLLLLMLMLLLLLLLVLLVELFLVLFQCAELVFGNGHGKATASAGHTPATGRPSAFDDLHREPVGSEACLCCRRWESGGSRKWSHPLDHVRKVHPLGMQKVCS